MDLFYPPRELPEGTRRTIRFDKKRPDWTPKETVKKEAEPRAGRTYVHGKKTQAILEALATEPGKFVSVQTLIELTGAGKSTVEGVLAQANKRGEIEKKLVKGKGRVRYKYYRLKGLDHAG